MHQSLGTSASNPLTSRKEAPDCSRRRPVGIGFHPEKRPWSLASQIHWPWGPAPVLCLQTGADWVSRGQCS